jgi:transglutaminase-like putative cysteine protease
MTAPASSRFRGFHTTTYTYSEPVFLESHTIRLRPRPDPGQLVHGFSIDIDPVPDGITSGLDAWGNNVDWAWFSGEHERLEITSRFDVERVRTNPYDFVVTNAAEARVPPLYPAHEVAALAPYMVASDPGPHVRAFAEEVARAASHDVLTFARELAERIHDRCEMIVRPEGDAYPGAQTLDEGKGSCRDFAVLYVEACRHIGVASRFVSGYVEHRAPDEPRELHAWAGVYLPGGGWRGYDPTQGLAVSTGHITLAVANVPKGAGSVSGSFVGNGATSRLESTIEFDVEMVPVDR